MCLGYGCAKLWWAKGSAEATKENNLWGRKWWVMGGRRRQTKRTNKEDDISWTENNMKGERKQREGRRRAFNYMIIFSLFRVSDMLKILFLFLDVNQLESGKLVSTSREETFVDSEALRSLGTSLVSNYADKVDDYKDKVVVQSSKKKENKTRRKREFVSTAVSSQSLTLKANQEDLLGFSASLVKRAPNTKNKRILVAKREAEMSKGVKVLAELEKMRTAIEEDTKRVASLSTWAEASGVDEKVLQKLLHRGYYCQDELIRSTRSLVLYLARKYRGMGIALDDLLQAGYVGVLQGAERFDSTRGYKFSTYVQYWIRKSILRVVARYARGIVIPWSLNRAINQIQKARKAMKSTHKKCPDDYEIAKMTGLSLDKIKSASNCLRIVASIDQKVGDYLGVEYMELLPDATIESPEDAVMKQHMRKDVHDLLKGLNLRERKILTLRFGLNDNQPRSLQDIGTLFKVSKERIRKIEKKALTKLKNEATISKLHYYLDL
ncbi:hypothetical protein JHK87_047796 [Glycine soja]|nr:hypothetical protein JHK87_047796 [Glycine soja]